MDATGVVETCGQRLGQGNFSRTGGPMANGQWSGDIAMRVSPRPIPCIEFDRGNLSTIRWYEGRQFGSWNQW